MLVRRSISPVAAIFLPLLIIACTPGGAGSTDDSGAGSETGTTSGSTAGSTTTGSASAGGDPTTGASNGSTSTPGDTSTSDATDASTSTSTSTSKSTTGSTTDESTISSTGDGSAGDASTGDASTGSTGSTGGDSTGGGDGLGPAALAAIDALAVVVDGVKWPSESDYGWTVFGLPKAAPVTIGNLKQIVGDLIVVDDGEPPLAEQGVEEEPWQQRFDKMTTPQPWWEDYNYMLAEKYEAIRTVLQAHLVDIKLFRIGPDDGNGNLSGAIDMFVIGETADGDLVGIQTVSVET